MMRFLRWGWLVVVEAWKLASYPCLLGLFSFFLGCCGNYYSPGTGEAVFG